MSIIDAVEEPVKKWVLGVAIKKGANSAAKFIVAWCFSHCIVIAAAPLGIQIDTTNEGVMAVAINSFLKVIFHLIKDKWPGKFDWLP